MGIRITRNDAALDLANGGRFKVAEVAPGTLTIEGAGRRIELPADKPMHLDLAYATTVHSAQGLTTDRVLIEAQTESRTTAKEYYVAISRARHEARIYTNDVKKPPAVIVLTCNGRGPPDSDCGRNGRQGADKRSLSTLKRRGRGSIIVVTSYNLIRRQFLRQ